MARRRVVVTGMGMVCPLATGVSSSWTRLIAGKSGIVSIGDPTEPTFQKRYPQVARHQNGYAEIPSKIAALVRHGTELDEFNISRYFKKGEDKRLSPFMHYAIAAAHEAIEDAKWTGLSQSQKDRTGVCIGSGIGSIDDVAAGAESLSQGFKKVSPFFVPKILINMAAGHLSIEHGFRGPNVAPSTACTTGAHAIGDAARWIMFGDADVMVAGGTESSVSPLSMAGFARARALSTSYNDDPTAASRPFDRDRSGFVIGEGSGVVVLEEYEHAKARGARIYAELAGYGASGDAHHMTAPPEDGSGAALSMGRALSNAGRSIHEVDYLNAHATSTELGDLAETRAVKSLFNGSEPAKLAVSSTKGATGHLLGGAGAVEAIFTILSVVHDMIPPSLNLHNLEPEFDLDFVALKSREKANGGVQVAMTNSFGFGGTNASIVFARV
ncbi:thiolase-like protein [Cladochytrium replicatum]|nr:thiolase-like protein [Cladochytrium replicatum]